MSDCVLDVSNMTIRFGGLVAVSDVSLQLKKKQVHGLIGPNGAGKTTFFNAITGLVRQAGGSVSFRGQNITDLPAHKRAEIGIRRSFQSVQLVQNLTVLENILIGLHSESAKDRLRGIGRLFRSTGPDGSAQRQVHEVAAFLGIERTLLKPVTEITFAEQRFVEIARAIVSRPSVLMLDEPAAGLSEAEIQRLDALLRRLVNEWDMSILLVEHVLSLVMVVSDEITVLDNGKFVTNGSPTEVAANPRVKSAYLGEEAHA